METVKGYKYTLEGHEDLDKFAKGILFMVNAQSSRKGTIVNVQTLDGSNIVVVDSLIEIDSEVEAYFKEVRSKEIIDILQLDFDDLNKKAQGWIQKQEASDEETAQDYVVTLPTNFFW